MALKMNPDILHISAHCKKNCLSFEKISANTESFDDKDEISIDRLLGIFKKAREAETEQFKLKLVYLSACTSNMVGEALVREFGIHVACSKKDMLELVAKRHTCPFYTHVLNGEFLCLAHKRATD